MDENTTLTHEQVDEMLLEYVKLRQPYIEVDEDKFLQLLKNSLSLSVSEKKRVIEAIPTLSQFQFDELQKVFLEEREKFKELAGEHPEDIKKLLKKQQDEWIDLGEIYILEQQKQAVSWEDEQKIEDLKKQFGL